MEQPALFTLFLSHFPLCCCYFAAALWCPVMRTTFHLFLLLPVAMKEKFSPLLSPRPKLSDQGNQVDNFTGASLGESRKSYFSAEQNVTLVFGSMTTHSRGPLGPEVPFMLP